MPLRRTAIHAAILSAATAHICFPNGENLWLKQVLPAAASEDLAAISGALGSGICRRPDEVRIYASSVSVAKLPLTAVHVHFLTSAFAPSFPFCSASSSSTLQSLRSPSCLYQTIPTFPSGPQQATFPFMNFYFLLGFYLKTLNLLNLQEFRCLPQVFYTFNLPINCHAQATPLISSVYLQLAI